MLKEVEIQLRNVLKQSSFDEELNYLIEEYQNERKKAEFSIFPLQDRIDIKKQNIIDFLTSSKSNIDKNEIEEYINHKEESLSKFYIYIIF